MGTILITRKKFTRQIGDFQVIHDEERRIMNEDRMILVNPVFANRDLEVDPDLVFVIMPFREQFFKIYADHLKPVVSKMGLKCKRADDIFTSRNIIEDIWSNIAKSRIIIADLSNRNPNVFYEIGIAHTIGKDVILITDADDDVPFDVNHIRCFNYKITPQGMKEFENKLRLIIKETLKSSLVVNPGYMQAKTALELAYKKWTSTKSLPNIDTYRLITEFSDNLIDSMDVDRLAFMFRAALQHGEHLIYWVEHNKNNNAVVEHIDEVIKGSYRKPFYRIGLSLEHLDKSLRSSMIKKYAKTENQKLKIVLDKVKGNKTIEFWEGGKVEGLSTTDLSVMVNQAKSSKRKETKPIKTNSVGSKGAP